MKGVDGCKLFPKKRFRFSIVNLLFKTERTFHQTGVKMYSNTKFLLRKFVSIKAFYSVAAAQNELVCQDTL
jgi:hypothetical protein